MSAPQALSGPRSDANSSSSLVGTCFLRHDTALKNLEALNAR